MRRQCWSDQCRGNATQYALGGFSDRGGDYTYWYCTVCGFRLPSPGASLAAYNERVGRFDGPSTLRRLVFCLAVVALLVWFVRAKSDDRAPPASVPTPSSTPVN